MKSLFTVLFIAVSGVVALASAAQADDKPMTRAQTEELIKKVIEDNPELIIKSVETYQIRQQADMISKVTKTIVKMKKQLQDDPHSPSIGNPKGDVTIVEFFDYHCGYCKRFFPVLAQLADQDKGVRVVFKEFPILSKDSALAAKAALAVYALDKTKYFAYHTALMKASGAFGMDMLTSTAKDAGVDPEKFKKAMEDPALDKEIENNKKLAEELTITGTPAIIVGDELLPGAVELDTLKAKVAAVREDEKHK